jgi:hypothetical protein
VVMAIVAGWIVAVVGRGRWFGRVLATAIGLGDFVNQLHLLVVLVGAIFQQPDRARAVNLWNCGIADRVGDLVE